MWKIETLFWTVFSLALLILIIYLLWIPIIVYLNTNTNQYYIQLRGLAKASIEGDTKNLIRIQLRVFFMDFRFYPLKKWVSKKKKKPKKAKTGKRKKKVDYEKIVRLLKSFRIKQFLLNVDTGDCITNAKLFPVFALLNYGIGGFQVNFEGQNQLTLQLQNRPIHLIRSFINF